MKLDVEKLAREMHEKEAWERFKVLKKPNLTPQEAQEHLPAFRAVMKRGGVKPSRIGSCPEEIDAVEKRAEAIGARTWQER